MHQGCKVENFCDCNLHGDLHGLRTCNHHQQRSLTSIHVVAKAMTLLPLPHIAQGISKVASRTCRTQEPPWMLSSTLLSQTRRPAAAHENVLWGMFHHQLPMCRLSAQSAFRMPGSAQSCLNIRKREYVPSASRFLSCFLVSCC
jgi:hypothetical protein